MIKFILTSFVLVSQGLVALPMRNVAEPALLEGLFFNDCFFGFDVGIDADYVYQSHLKGDSLGNHRRIEQAKKREQAAFVSLNLFDRFDIFTTLGGAHFYFNSSALNFNPNPDFGLDKGQRLEIESKTAFCWSVGARGLVWQCNRAFVGLEGEYFNCRSDIHSVILQTTGTANPSNVTLNYHEGQIGVELGYHVASCLVAYGGAKWSTAYLHFGNSAIFIPGRDLAPAVTLVNLASSRHWGYAIGMTWTLRSAFDVTLEWRMNNEEAFYLNGQFRF